MTPMPTTSVERARTEPPASASRRGGPSPAWAVRLEVLRSIGQGVLLAPRLLTYLASHRRALDEIARDLQHPSGIDPAPLLDLRKDTALTIFVACAEVSGETHAVNAVRAMRSQLALAGARAPRFIGLGGPRLASAGVEIIGNPVDRAQMGLGVWSSIPWYARLLRDAAEHLRDERPDVLLAVDSPALHVPLARIARRYCVPTVHFVTPQYWGWAPWRARAYANSIERALSILPFEKPWLERRGIRVAHVGHPLLDALASVPRTTPRDDARELVILPGSRSGVIARNLPWMLRVADRMRARLGDVPVVVAHERADIGREIQAVLEREGAHSWARLDAGDLHACLARARTALSVSGTVLIDTLHQALPTVVVYRLAHGYEVRLKDRLLTVPWFSSVNLLAGRAVYPEYCFAGEGPIDAVADALVRLHDDPKARAECFSGLALARERLGPAGACERAALHVLDVAVARRPDAGLPAEARP